MLWIELIQSWALSGIAVAQAKRGPGQRSVMETAVNHHIFSLRLVFFPILKFQNKLWKWAQLKKKATQF